MYVMTMSRKQPDISCIEMFEEAEWKSVCKVTNKKAPIPVKPPSLGEFVLMVAKLGGYLPRKNSPPGPEVIWRGLKRVYDFSLAWVSFAGCDAA